jgi:protein-S-isoprenylcysteine O-methyltransferase Ste14
VPDRVTVLKAGRMLRVIAARSVPPAMAVLAVPRLRRLDLAVPLAGLTAWTVGEILAEHEMANRAAAGGSQDRGTRHAMVGVHLASWWAPLLVNARRPERAPDGAVVLGAVTLAAGAALRITAVRTLGEFFTGSVRVGSDQPVCDRGVYALVRHPSYVGLVLLNLAPAVSCGRWRLTAAMAAATAASIGARVVVEERSLTAMLGHSYRAYCARTPRWIPRRRAR